MKIIRTVFAVGYASIIVLFICCAFSLIYFALLELWHGINPGDTVPLRERFNSILEGIGWLTIAVVALELGQTILEEEVLRAAHVSAPTRVRRFLSRFMVVIVVALSIETLVAVFELAHNDPRTTPSSRDYRGRGSRATGRVGGLRQTEQERRRIRARGTGTGEKRGPEDRVGQAS